MWWIVGIVIVAFVIYRIRKSHTERVTAEVSRFGGMLEKYKTIVDYLKDSGTAIQKVTKDSVVLASRSMTWYLDYVSPNLEVQMKGFLPILGNVSKRWVFPSGYPQEKMIEEINNYAEWQLREMQKLAENNPYEHLREE